MSNDYVVEFMEIVRESFMHQANSDNLVDLAFRIYLLANKPRQRGLTSRRGCTCTWLGSVS
jgi:hypothetical protein